jgi:AcrR family transcriptional regulator
MPRVLSDTDISDFRDRCRNVAERLCVEQGPEAVTMRQLASHLGVSPMTPYRYFEDKNDILAAVRAENFNRFAEILEAARAGSDGARARAAAIAEAYVTFALENPHAYKLMFDFNQPRPDAYPELAAAARRAQQVLADAVQEAAGNSGSNGDQGELGLTHCAAIHGMVILELSHMLPAGGARQAYRAMSAALQTRP